MMIKLDWDRLQWNGSYEMKRNGMEWNGTERKEKE